MQLNTPHRYFKGETSELGAVLGLLSKELDIGTAFDNFREKLKGYVERKFYNVKDVMCVVTYMEDPMKTFEDNNITEYLNEEEENSILNKKRIGLSLTGYMEREDLKKIKIIFGVVFGKCTLSLQSVLKGVPGYEKKPKDCNCLWLMEELNKITAGVDVKSNPRLPPLEHLIKFFTIRKEPTERNNEYLERFNYRLKNLILAGGKHIMCILKNIYKVGDTATT